MSKDVDETHPRMHFEKDYFRFLPSKNVKFSYDLVTVAIIFRPDSILGGDKKQQQQQQQGAKDKLYRRRGEKSRKGKKTEAKKCCRLKTLFSRVLLVTQQRPARKSRKLKNLNWKERRTKISLFQGSWCSFKIPPQFRIKTDVQALFFLLHVYPTQEWVRYKE